MITLALLFGLIIGLLWVVIVLLKKYFETYSNVYSSENNKEVEIKKCLELQKNQASLHKINSEINQIIEERLIEMEQKFTDQKQQEELPETFTRDFKRVLHSTLNLLKEEQYNTSNNLK